jgi:hypothetical protein
MQRRHSPNRMHPDFGADRNELSTNQQSNHLAKYQLGCFAFRSIRNFAFVVVRRSFATDTCDRRWLYQRTKGLHFQNSETVGHNG